MEKIIETLEEVLEDITEAQQEWANDDDNDRNYGDAIIDVEIIINKKIKELGE